MKIAAVAVEIVALTEIAKNNQKKTKETEAKHKPAFGCQLDGLT